MRNLITGLILTIIFLNVAANSFSTDMIYGTRDKTLTEIIGNKYIRSYDYIGCYIELVDTNRKNYVVNTIRSAKCRDIWLESLSHFQNLIKTNHDTLYIVWGFDCSGEWIHGRTSRGDSLHIIIETGMDEWQLSRLKYDVLHEVAIWDTSKLFQYKYKFDYERNIIQDVATVYRVILMNDSALVDSIEIWDYDFTL